MKEYSKTNHGFTIIELIIVIAIIAILTSVVIVNVSTYIDRSNVVSVKSDLAQLSSSVMMYYASNSTMNGFCQDSNTLTIEHAINKISSSYHISCVDGTTSSYVYNPEPWVAYASPGRHFTPTCDSSGAVFWVSGLPQDLVSAGTLCSYNEIGSGSAVNVNYDPSGSSACSCGS